MSEYWVSHKKYFCKYCNIYIADDAPSRNHHESGLRHKGNVERFVRNLYKTGEKKKHDLEEEKREMARVEMAAQAAYAQDVGAGLVKPGSGSGLSRLAPKESTSQEPKKPSSSDPYANYSTAASLGFTDPDAERHEAEVERRRTQGVVGDWEVVEADAPVVADVEETEGHGEEGLVVGVKREAEAEEDNEDGRVWKLKKKKITVGLGELYDPGSIPIKLKKPKKEEPTLEEGNGLTLGSNLTTDSSATPSTSNVAGSGPLKWSARGWNKPSEAKATSLSNDEATPPPTTNPEVATSSTEQVINPESSLAGALDKGGLSLVSVKAEEDGVPVKAEETSTAVPSAASGGLFRKRKLPANGPGTRGRRG